MTGYSVTSKSGRAEVGQFDAMFRPRITEPAVYPIVACHGANSQWHQWMSQSFPRMHQLLVEAANGGIPSVAAMVGGASTYGNPTSVTAVDTDLTAVATAVGCSDDKVHLVGASMGAGVALLYGIANPTKVASMTLCIPMASIIALYDNNNGGHRAGIGTAWGVTYPTPLPAGADILANAATLSGIPIRFYYATDDAIITPSDVTDLATAIGPSATVTATTGGHTDAGLLPTGFDFDEWVAWLVSNGG